MAVRHPCPTCRREMLLEPVHEGFEVPCPHCGARHFVPPGTVSAPDGTPAAVPGGDASAQPVPPPRRPPTEADGSLPLVFGILGLVGAIGAPCTMWCLTPLALFAPIAWFLGHSGRAAARSQGREPPGPVTAGWVLGIVGTCLIVLGAVAIVLLIVLAAAGSR